MDLDLNNQKWLICNKNLLNKTIQIIILNH